MTEEERKRLLSQINIISLDDTSNEANQIRARVNQQDQNFFADVGRVFEATGAGISSTLSNLGKGALLAGRDLGGASDFADKITNEMRNKSDAELEDIAKKNNISTTTLKDYINKSKTSYENINDFSANTFDKWANEANQRVQELQAETDNPFTKEVIGFMPNLSQQAVNVGVSFINPALVPYVAGLEAKGSYYNDAKQRGMTDEQANDFSTAMAGVEAFTEKLTVKDVKAGITKIGEVKSLLKGGIKGATKEATQEAVKETTKSGIKEAFKSLAKGMGENAFQEGVTEIIQEAFADAITKKDLGQSFYDFLNQQDNWEDIWGRVFKSAVGGALSAGITGGVGMGVSSCVSVNNKIQNGEQVTQQEILQANQDAIEKSKTLPKEQQEQFNEQITQGSEIGIQNVINQVETEQNQPQNEQKSAVPMQTSENAQQQVQEQEQQVISNQDENALNQNVEPQNLVESAERSGIDVKDEKTRKNLETIQKFNENRGVKATFDADAFKGHDNVNSFFRTDENGNREIVFNPNTKTDKTIEQLAVHEVYHDMVAGGTAQELTDFVVRKMSSNPEYQEYVRALQDVYEEQDSDIIKEEAVAHYLEKNLGTDEFISELQQRGDRTTIQRIIDTIKDMITKAKNTLTGKGDLNYLLDLQRKYEQAYRGEFKGSQEQTKLSKQVDGNETEPIKVQYKGEEREYKNYYDYMKDISENEEQLANNLLFKHNSYDFEIPTSKNETSFYHGTDYSGYYKDLNLQDYGYGMDRNYGDYFYVTSDKTQTTPYGKQIAQFIIPNDKILSLEEYRKMGNVSDEELFNKYLAIEMPDNEYIIKDIDKVKEYTLDKAKEYIKNKDQQTQPTTDNQGRTLTKEQQDYFKDSKVRDENGNLLEVYHGSPNKFTQFDKTKIGNATDSGMFGRGFYFTDSQKYADGYNMGKSENTQKVYLDIKNPYIIESEDSLNEFNKIYLKNSKEQMKYFEKYGADYFDKFLENSTKELKQAGFDGVIVKPFGNFKDTEIVAFEPNQIKNVDNTNPTESPDIRYSKEAPTKDNQVENTQDFDNFLNENNYKFTTDGRLKTGKLSEKQIKTLLNLYKTTGYEDVSPEFIRDRLENNRLIIPREVADRFIEKELGYKPKFDTTKITEDADGRKLTKEQIEFYKDSDVRDVRGRLIPVYHRTNADFTIFDKKAGKQHGNKYGSGFYFSITPENYGNNTMEVYLNAKEGEYKYIPKQGYYVVQDPNQIKNVTNLKPTDNPDINLSKQGAGTSQQIIDNFLENTKVNEGTGTAIKDLARVPVPKTDYKALLQPQLDRLSASDKAQMSEIIDNLDAQGQLNEEAYNSALETINALQEVAQETTPTDELSVKLRDGKYGKFDSELSDYRNRYNKGQLDYNKDVVNSAMELVPGKKIQGQQKRTKAEWLRIAQHIGQDIANLSDQQVKDTAYATWLDLAPNNKNTLNREGGKYVDFKSQEWNNAIYDAVKQNRTEITETEQTRQVAPEQTIEEKLLSDDRIKSREIVAEYTGIVPVEPVGAENILIEAEKLGWNGNSETLQNYIEQAIKNNNKSRKLSPIALQELMEQVTQTQEPVRQVAPSEAPAQVPQVNEVKQRQVEPIRDITDVQRPQVPQNQKTRKTYESIINSNQMTREAKQIARELMGYDTYVPQTNKFTLEQADRNIKQNGVDESLTTLTNKINNNNKVDAIDIATGERLIEYYSKIGDRQKLQEAIQSTAMAGTEAGRAVQAMSMISHQTPIGQVTWIQRSVDKVNKRLAKEGKKAQFNFTPEMQQKILNSTSENLQQNLNEVYQELGKQVPKSNMEKFNEWRYFSMLANPKTHFRNILGNLVMAQVQRAKNKVAGTIEDFVIGDNAERWNSLKGASKGMYEFAKNDLKNADVQSMLGLNENKYNPQNRLQQNQRTFKNNFLEGTLGKLFNLNSKLLEVEDGWGLKSGYAKAMANYLNANNLDYTNLTDTQLQKARQYAVEQAKEATFHQDNSIANMLQTIENKNLFTKIAVGGAIPYKKTPMNVALTGFEYSPAGFVKTLTTDLVNLRKGKISANQFIDNISKNLTGTAISLLGYGLTQAGILKASGSGDEDKDEFEEATGKQNYSIQIGDKTYSLDWLTPAGIPLFIGSELYQVSHQKEDGNKTKNENEAFKSITKILDATASAMNPMSEMTMISGLTNALKSYAQGSTKSIENMLANVGKSYVTQTVPTALGQIARSTDQYERSTTSTETDPMAKAIDSAKNQIISKIPGLRETLPVSTDVWGNARETQSYEENAILPWTSKEISKDPVNKALTDLYDATGESGVLPDNYIDKSLTIDKEKYKLTNEEYARLKQQYGKTAHDILSDLTKSKEYEQMSDEQKVKAVKEAYSYAKSTLKVTYSDENNLDAEESSTYKKVQSVIDNGGDAKEYFEYTGLIDGVKKEKEKRQILLNSNIKDKGAIYESTIGSDDETYQIMKATGIDPDAYLEYKQQDFSSDKEDDGTVKGKTVSGSGKTKFYDYMDNANMTYEQKLLLTGMKYKLLPGERDTLANYIDTLPISASEKTDIYKKLKGATVYQNGEIYY